MSLFYAQKPNPKQKKSQEVKLSNSFRPSALAKSAEQQFKSYIKNEKQYMINPYFTGSSDFYKSFGSSTYNPSQTSVGNVTSGKKLASLKNNLVMTSYSNKNSDPKNSSFQHNMKAMK